jgi:hypothetical protein
MPKLRLAVILPILIVCLDLPVALWQSHVDAQQPPKHEYPIVSPVTLAYRGLNAPALIFRGLCEAALPVYRIDHDPPTLLGVGSGQLFFFAGVVLLWFTVGLSFDRRRSCEMHRQTATTIWRVLGTLLFVAFAMLLFGGGVFVIRHRPAGNPVGDVLQGILFFGWSAVVAVTSAMRHVTAISPNAIKDKGSC